MPVRWGEEEPIVLGKSGKYVATLVGESWSGLISFIPI